MKTIYYGGPIITMERETDSPEAVLVADGWIEAVGSLTEVRELAGAQAELVDLKGACLMPAFIDGHSHIIMNARMSLCADLSPCQSFDDIVRVLRQYISDRKVTPPNSVIGFGYDHNFLKEKCHPDKRLLDQVSKEIPILIFHVSAHFAAVNSAALALVGITEETEDPQGGLIGRVPGTREPSGYLEESGVNLAEDPINEKLAITQEEMFVGMQNVYLERGITTVQDGASNVENVAVLKELSEAGKLKVDVAAYPVISAGGREVMRDNQEMVRTYRNHLKLAGYKLVLDGSPQGRSAWMSQPYMNGEEGYCGYPWLTDEEVESYARQAVDDGQQLIVHCNGDAASEQYLNAYEKALRESENPEKYELRPVMIHCQTVRNDQLDRMAKIPMLASIFVGHVWYWGDIHVKNFGPERGNHISPARDALDRGLKVTFHQDAPITKPDMLHSVWCAVNRISRGGSVVGENQKLSVYEALQAVTIHSAYQYFEEETKGSIKKGKQADLIILDRSPLAVPPMEIRDIQILRTIKDGETVYQNTVAANVKN